MDAVPKCQHAASKGREEWDVRESMRGAGQHDGCDPHQPGRANPDVDPGRMTLFSQRAQNANLSEYRTVTHVSAVQNHDASMACKRAGVQPHCMQRAVLLRLIDITAAHATMFGRVTCSHRDSHIINSWRGVHCVVAVGLQRGAAIALP